LALVARSAEGTIRLGSLGPVGAGSTRMAVLYTASWCIVVLAGSSRFLMVRSRLDRAASVD
jgi:hypothetical protein